MTSTREHFIAATCELLETQGYYATGLNEIIAESGAPRGSLYYYFPEGKEELAAAAIGRAGEMLAQRTAANLASVDDPATAMRRFVERIASAVEASDYRTGGPLQAVAVETAATSERLNLACRAAYMGLQQVFVAKLIASGYERRQAVEMATFVTATIEGGIILSRTYHSGDPLRLVAQQLGDFIQTRKNEDVERK